MDPFSAGSVETKAAPDVWIVPLVYISHVRCFLQFAKQLARHGVTVTFFCNEEDAERLGINGPNNTILESWKRQGIDLRLKEYGVKAPQIADGVDDDGENRTRASLEEDKWVRATDEQTEKFEDILKRELESRQSKPTCIISDYWCPPSVVYMSELQSKGILKLPTSALDKEAEELISLPGMPLMRINELDTVSTFVTSLLHSIGKRIGPTLLRAEVVLFSTFQELDPKPLIELGRCTQSDQLLIAHQRVYLELQGKNGYEEKERDPCLKFLDGQAESSVLFAAFGCTWNLLPEQMQEIALGLESSGQPFLVSFQPPVKTAKYQTDDIFDVLPRDCVEHTKGRGLFVPGWVPQVQILAHPAVGGFLSHCGHNSYLESVYMGVPLITWPIFCEQYMNARYIVDEIQVGIEVPQSAAISDLVDRKEVEAKVRALFQSEQGKTARKNMLKYRELAVRSVSENGSTFNNMKMIVVRIRDLAAGRTTT
ncbi:hypothetical protein R1sor_015544 [Riccia sorocarpa]|uniref:Glycosyltransferase n=1 Tax=Riccia sorocarpa TaxID=122646 RepID=A0ABD3HCJ3_9MARC